MPSHLMARRLVLRRRTAHARVIRVVRLCAVYHVPGHQIARQCSSASAPTSRKLFFSGTVRIWGGVAQHQALDENQYKLTLGIGALSPNDIAETRFESQVQSVTSLGGYIYWKALSGKANMTYLFNVLSGIRVRPTPHTARRA